MLFNPPAGIGRIPRKIESAFASFTADKWKHWTLIYSVYALYKVIPEEHYKCWCLFVDGCQILCRLTITPEEITDAQHYIVEFCKTFEVLYGKEACTPNMHIACHLQQCLLDYGSLATFGAFSFERYNGLLEGLQKSWNGPEKQMLQKFLGLQAVHVGELMNSSEVLMCMMKSSGVLPSSSITKFSSCDQTSLH